MSSQIIFAADYGFRKVIRVVMDSTIPKWLHPIDGAEHTLLTARGHSLPDGTPGPLDPSLQAGTECHTCVFNHDVREFIFTHEKLQVGLNKWGNPVHGNQETIASRAKTWDELYSEVDNQLGKHVTFGKVPREKAPTLVEEVELAFELVKVGEASMDGDTAEQLFRVLRLGVVTATFIARGTDAISFAADRDEKYAESQTEILAIESNKAAALAIVA